MKNNSKRIFYGILLILCAVLVIMSGMGVLPGLTSKRLIPTLIFGLLTLACAVHKDIILSLLFAALLFNVYKDMLGFEKISGFLVVLAAILLGAGLKLIFRRKNPSITLNINSEDCDSYGSDGEDYESNGILREKASFSSKVRYVNSNDFKSALFEVNFGNLSVYFNNDDIPGGTAEINVDLNFGNIELFVPRDWEIDDKIIYSFSTHKGTRVNSAFGGPVLRIKGSCDFGSLSVTRL